MPGLAGRKPKPAHIKLVEGDRGKRTPRRAAAASKPIAPLALPSKPKHIAANAIASGEWDRLLELTTAPGARVLSIADGPMLEAAALAYAQMRTAQAATDKSITYETTSRTGAVMTRARPEVAIAAEAWRRWVTALTHFGLSPAMRAKVKPFDEEAPIDPAEAHFGD